MSIKIVTDSTADLPPKLIKELDIKVVPAYVRFGKELYRDGVDISDDELYHRLLSDPVHPVTEPPTPQDFTRVYEELSREADGIVSIHISSKLSATCNSALRAQELLPTDFPIEVIDSKLVTMGLGLLVKAAAQIVKSESALPYVVDKVNKVIPDIKVLGLLDTLKYLARGGRIGRAKALLGTVLSVKPILTIKDGEVEPAGQVRSWESGVDELYNFARNLTSIQDISIIYSTVDEEAKALSRRISAFVDEDKIILARLGPVLGVHTGPDILFVAVRT